MSMSDKPSSKRPGRYGQKFDPRTLDKTLISIPLLDEMEGREAGLSPDTSPQNETLNVIIDANLQFSKSRDGARKWIIKTVRKLVSKADAKSETQSLQSVEKLHDQKNEFSDQYVFARLRAGTIRELVRRDREEHGPKDTAIYKIWLDHKAQRFINKSLSTIKADAARNAFGALGHDIVWAVVDSGIDSKHPHFSESLKLMAPLRHRDFTSVDGDLKDATDDHLQERALQDLNGHGTHVAGIIAGEYEATEARPIQATLRELTENRSEEMVTISDIKCLSGIAPKCKLMSLKVLDRNGEGETSNILAALEYIQKLNGYGRRLLVHGVNLSVGYDFEPKWFACGQSPLCVEVNRLVRSGVVVVVAAGNTGYGFNEPGFEGPLEAGLGITINDPGNADLAITVGSTHRNMPHTYGVSYFSSKGPTGDGRLKPDLVAPGERIISCEANAPEGPARYCEDSGTSMAAPHVSGAIAAFLSIRREFIGEPERIKQIFLDTATDLGRVNHFQGRGLLDLMRAIQSV